MLNFFKTKLFLKRGMDPPVNHESNVNIVLCGILEFPSPPPLPAPFLQPDQPMGVTFHLTLSVSQTPLCFFFVALFPGLHEKKRERERERERDLAVAVASSPL